MGLKGFSALKPGVGPGYTRVSDVPSPGQNPEVSGMPGSRVCPGPGEPRTRIPSATGHSQARAARPGPGHVGF
jgi:hypothetical protein